VNRRILALSACLTLLSSCSTAPNWSADDSARPPLPAEVSFNLDAGHDQSLNLTLRLENGKELLFAVDTGASGTLLDKSLEPILGKRLETTDIVFPSYGKTKSGVHEAPKLYLGGVQLPTGDQIDTGDLTRIEDHFPLMGILGMDCLRHYCIQLDFAAGKIRFLDPDNLKSENLGRVFPLTIDSETGQASTHANFFGQEDAHFAVDTGYTTGDAALKPKAYQQKVQELHGEVLLQTKEKYSPDVTENKTLLSEVIFNGEACTNFLLGDCPDRNLLGLRFLARHLVTLDFPKHTMYLQRRSDEPFADDGISATNASASTKEATEFLTNLKKQGQLPGWLNDEDQGQLARTPNQNTPEMYPIERIFFCRKNGDAYKYYRYIVVKASKDGTWKLQRAWQTDASGRFLQEFPVP
jgi:predicted aspartyl protease